MKPINIVIASCIKHLKNSVINSVRIIINRKSWISRIEICVTQQHHFEPWEITLGLSKVYFTKGNGIFLGKVLSLQMNEYSGIYPCFDYKAITVHSVHKAYFWELRWLIISILVISMIENTHLELLISYKSSLPADCKLFAVLAWNANPWRKKHNCIQHRKTWDRKCSQVPCPCSADSAETDWFSCNDFNAKG